MKIKLVVFAVLLLAFSIEGFAQTVKIMPKKIVYTRKGKQFSDYKKTFVITYPQVSGTINAAAKKKLDSTISYWRVFETTLRESQNSDWLSEMSYKINYNKKSILDIALTQEGSGAYPDGETINLVIDLNSGEQIKFKDAFKINSLDKFAKMVDKKLSNEKAELIQRVNKGEFRDADGKEGDDYLKEQIGALKFLAGTFNEFSISDEGITIIYDARFPHVIQALQPDGRYFFTWAEVKPFIKPGGLLARFVR
jgi:hypothetical protein